MEKPGKKLQLIDQATVISAFSPQYIKYTDLTPQEQADRACRDAMEYAEKQRTAGYVKEGL